MILATLFIVFGGIGSALTFKSSFQTDATTENTIIKDHFTAIEINGTDANVNILSTTDREAQIELTGDMSDYHLATEVDEDVLKINIDFDQKKLFNFDFSFRLLELTVYLPEETYDSLHLRNDNGQIQMSDVHIEDIVAETDNGKVMLNDLKSHDIQTKSDNGHIALKNIHATKINTEAENGKINLENVVGELVGKADNGHISLITEEINRPIDLSTDNGKITIQTENKPTNVTFDIRVDNGKVDYFGESTWDTIIGEGENLVHLKTDNGNIKLTN